MADNKIISSTTPALCDATKYAKPRMNKSGGKAIAVLNSETNKPFLMSTPLMLTWGVEEYIDESNGRRSYSMSLQFPRDEYRTEATDAFLENMKAFEAKIRKDIVAHAKEWMNKNKLTPEVVDALMTPMLRYRKDPNTGEPDLTSAPTLKVKLDYWDESFNCEIYDLQQQPLFPSEDSGETPMTLIPKGTNTALVLKCGGLWFAAGRCGVTWRLFQAVVKPKATLRGKCHIVLSADESQRLAAAADEEEDADEVGVEVAEDSDEEEEEENVADEVAEEVAAAVSEPSFTPAPAPPAAAATKAVKKKAVKKKVVRKKTKAAE